jgi:hypothetical protein
MAGWRRGGGGSFEAIADCGLRIDRRARSAAGRNRRRNSSCSLVHWLSLERNLAEMRDSHALQYKERKSPLRCFAVKSIPAFCFSSQIQPRSGGQYSIPIPFSRFQRTPAAASGAHFRLAEGLGDGISTGCAGVPPDRAAGRAETVCQLTFVIIYENSKRCVRHPGRDAL